MHPPTEKILKCSKASIPLADGRLTARSREVSNPRDSGLSFSNRSEIWQAPQQQCNIQYLGFRTSRDLVVTDGHWFVNSCKPNDAMMWQWTRSPLLRRIAYEAPNHCLNQCWIVINWKLGNIFQWILNQMTNSFIQFKKLELEYRLQKGVHFVPASMCYRLNWSCGELYTYFMAHIIRLFIYHLRMSLYRVCLRKTTKCACLGEFDKVTAGNCCIRLQKRLERSWKEVTLIYWGLNKWPNFTRSYGFVCMKNVVILLQFVTV